MQDTGYTQQLHAITVAAKPDKRGGGMNSSDIKPIVKFVGGPLDGQVGPAPWNQHDIQTVFADYNDWRLQSNDASSWPPNSILYLYTRSTPEEFQYVCDVLVGKGGHIHAIEGTVQPGFRGPAEADGAEDSAG
jgi:hypothetical protein